MNEIIQNIPQIIRIAAFAFIMYYIGKVVTENTINNAEKENENER